MDVDRIVALAGIFGPFDDVLFEGGALGVAISVELEQALGEVAVAHILLLEKEVDDGGVVATLHVVVEVGIGLSHAGHEVVIEGEGADLFEEFLNRGIFFRNGIVDPEIGGCESVEVFEHAGGRTRGRDKLEDFFILEILLVEVGVFVNVGIFEAEYAPVVYGCGIDEDGLGKSAAEIVQLMLYNVLGESQGGHLGKVVVVEFCCHNGCWGY
jgi:hypothetical protein